jgi:hypothetical protein
MNESSTENAGTEPFISRLPYIVISIPVGQGKALMVFICPFCYVLNAPPSNIVFTALHRCACGASFHKIGHATKSSCKLES